MNVEEQIINIDKLDAGIDTQLPSNKVTWSMGRNVRFTPGYVSKTSGKTLLATLPTANLSVRAIFAFSSADNSTIYSLICCDNKVFAGNSDLSNITDITPVVAPTGNSGDNWDYAIVAGIVLLTNGKDAIWEWPQYNSVLIPTNLPVAKNISNCMNRLVMSNITGYPGRVIWSEQGNPLNITVDTTRKAGYQDLVNYTDQKFMQNTIMKQWVTGSRVVFFTSANVWYCDFAQSAKQFIIMDNTLELLARRLSCVTDYGQLYAVDKMDLVRYDGTQKKLIGLNIKSSFFAAVNTTGLDNSFCFPIDDLSEVWFCIPTGNNTGAPDTAYIYNWELDNWTICDCNFLCYGTLYTAYNTVNWQNNSSSNVTWTNNSSQVVNWTDTFRSAVNIGIVGDSKSHLLLLDNGYNNLDSTLTVSPIYGVIETGDMDLGARHLEKIVKHIYLDFVSQSANVPLMIQVGVRSSLSSAIRWSYPVSFTLGLDSYADLQDYGNQGAFVRFRFYTKTLNSPWTLGSYAFKYSHAGGALR